MNQSADSNITYRSWCADSLIVTGLNLDASVNFFSNQEGNLEVFIATFEGSIADGVIGIFH
jgi:hypothetical protein